MKSYIKLMRIHHWIKNLLIFLPLLFSKRVFEVELLKNAVIGFISFSLITSCVYIMNDIYDIDKDRLHSTKCKRPIASGEISIKNAWLLNCILMVVAICLDFLLLSAFDDSLVLQILYLGINLAYSVKLKNIPLLDVTILTSGFLIRLLYGSAVTGIELSTWFYLTTMMGSFYLALGKRRNELVKEGDEKRKVLSLYTYNFLDKNMYMCLALTVVFYSLWATISDTALLYNNYLVFTVPIVFLICIKYSMNIEGESDGDPVEVLLNDKALILLCGVYATIIFAILYRQI